MSKNSEKFLARNGLRAAALLSVLLLTKPLSAQAQSWLPTATKAFSSPGAVLIGSVPANQRIDVAVAVKMRDKQGLDRLNASFLRPGSPSYGKHLTPQQLRQNYGPTQQDADAVVAYLQANGFTDIHVADNRLLVSAKGTPRSILLAFHTEMGVFSKNGQSGLGNIQAAQVPADLSNSILAVIGLDTVDTFHPATVKASGGVASPNNVSGYNGHYPTDFPGIYGVGSLPVASNAIVGIITVGSMSQPLADLTTYDNAVGLPVIHPTVVNVNGGGTTANHNEEWSLDTQTIQSVAGGNLSQMILYATASFTFNDITAALNAALGGSASVISMSIGGCETSASNSGVVAAEDQILSSAVGMGQTYVFSTGDNGSKECSGSAGALYPASSPYAIAVGGTSLAANGTTYVTETAWSGGGGSPSLVEPKPSWQNNIVPGSARGLPDVAFDADPATGALIYVNGTLQQYGGTSLSAPIFAGAWARVQSAATTTPGFPASAIYSYGANPPSSIFNDITSGSNGDYSAGSGWDYTTGFGSFKFAAFANVPVPPRAPSGFHAESQYCAARADLYWSTVTGASTYKIYRATGNTTSFILIATVPGSSSYYFDNNKGIAGQGATYYRIASCTSAQGCGYQSNIVAGTQYYSPCL